MNKEAQQNNLNFALSVIERTIGVNAYERVKKTACKEGILNKVRRELAAEVSLVAQCSSPLGTEVMLKDFEGDDKLLESSTLNKAWGMWILAMVVDGATNGWALTVAAMSGEPILAGIVKSGCNIVAGIAFELQERNKLKRAMKPTGTLA